MVAAENSRALPALIAGSATYVALGTRQIGSDSGRITRRPLHGERRRPPEDLAPRSQSRRKRGDKPATTTESEPAALRHLPDLLHSDLTGTTMTRKSGENPPTLLQGRAKARQRDEAFKLRKAARKPTLQ